MATLTFAGLTLADVAKYKGPDGNMLAMTEVLTKINDILLDAPFMEANDTFSNLSLRRSNLPAGTWRKLNYGVAGEKSNSVQVRDVIGILESLAETDKEIVDAYPDPEAGRSTEEMSFIEGLGQTMASTMIYGNTTTSPEKFTGVAPRLDALATTSNVLNEGGTGSDLTSVYVIDWGTTTAHMSYPKGSMAGLQIDDRGVQTVTDAAGGKFRAYQTFFTWKCGMVVRNPRSIGRLANIESAGAVNLLDEDNLITLINRMTRGPGRRIYMNETVMTQAEIRLKDKTNVAFTSAEGLAPGAVLAFKRIPIRQVDAIVNTEAALT